MSALLEHADKLRAHVDIADVVGRYVELRRAGLNLKGLCPIHKEKTPSFTVSPGKQIFHCFGCNEGGDVIKFIQKVERLEWIEALRLLSDQHNLPLPELRPGQEAQRHEERSEKDRLFQASLFAAETFFARLKRELQNSDSEIFAYFAKRNLDAELAIRFGLGLAPDGWQTLLELAEKKGISRATLIASGLAISNQAGRVYDRFRNRLIFTIHDSHGKPMAFGARVFASTAAADEPKYINSPESSLYHKGQALYALHLAKDSITKQGQAILMEGYMDVIRAHQNGFDNAVATCGTALTEEQARTLKRFCTKVTFIYDGDDAGQKAMLRGTEILLDNGFDVSIVGLPDKHDPDSFLLAKGREEFQAQLGRAKPFLAYFLETLARIHNPETPDGKVSIVEALLPLLRKEHRGIARNEHVRRIADFLRIDSVLVVRQLNTTNPKTIERLRHDVEEQLPAAGSRLECTLLKMAVEQARLRPQLLAEIHPDWIRHTWVRKWYEWMAISESDEITWTNLLAHTESELELSLIHI